MDGCPICSNKDTGKIGNGQFYCANCCIEYDSKNNIFGIEEDGTLVELDMYNQLEM